MTIADSSTDVAQVATQPTGPLSVVVMAAGRGSRMKSALPKVLHRLAGMPLLHRVLCTVGELDAAHVVVVTGHGADAVEAAIEAASVKFARQSPQLGTGHAVLQALPLLPDAGVTLMLNGDVPLVAAATARALVDACAGVRLALLTVHLADPTGYGRIVRSGEAVRAIVEQRDATPAQRAIGEVYTGMMAAPSGWLHAALARLRNDNEQGEYYLTDLVALAVADGLPVVACQPLDETEVLGVNSPAQLADLERRLQRRIAAGLMDAGVRLADPQRLDVRGTLRCGADVEIDVNCVFEGEVELGDGVRIGANCVIRQARIEAGTQVHAFSHVDGDDLGVTVGPLCSVGPFARLRPGARLAAEVHVGNFVEVKNATLGRGAKANHLAYVGDATLGERVNFGAGSITANYDGVSKHHTEIGADVLVGSNCVLVAPVRVGEGATIGAGSTIGRDAPAGQLSVARARQVTLSGWRRPKKPL